jgi:predicted enzyme related to lactoylglutathione lyase
MAEISARFLGAGLYFDDMEAAKVFYSQKLGLKLADHDAGAKRIRVVSVEG